MPRHKLDGESSSSSEEEQGEYKVEAILQKRRQAGKTQYLIKWEGYDESDNTWEPIENLAGCEDRIADFNEREKQRVAASCVGSGLKTLRASLSRCAAWRRCVCVQGGVSRIRPIANRCPCRGRS